MREKKILDATTVFYKEQRRHRKLAVVLICIFHQTQHTCFGHPETCVTLSVNVCMLVQILIKMFCTWICNHGLCDLVKYTVRHISDEAGTDEGLMFISESRPHSRLRRFTVKLPFLFSSTCGKRDGSMMWCVTLMCVSEWICGFHVVQPGVCCHGDVSSFLFMSPADDLSQGHINPAGHTSDKEVMSRVLCT